MLVVGVLTFDIRAPAASSLKDKRSVVKDLLERSRHKYSVFSAEIDKLDSCREAVLGFAYVGNETPFVESIMRKVEYYIARFTECEIIESDIELID